MENKLPAGFVYLDEALPGQYFDAKYAYKDNFTGAAVDGYAARRVVGAIELAEAMRHAADLAAQYGHAFLIWDAYRPQRAVDHFIRWAASVEDYATKAKHYPNIDKSDMVRLGYVAEKSSHTRGGAVDLTLCRASDGVPLDMGGSFDLMDDISHHGAAGISPKAAGNRVKLLRVMERSGFTPFEYEWWHYRLTNEPYPHTYFNFPIM